MDVPEFDTFKLQYWNHRELMMGDDGKPGKKIKVKGRVKRLDRPPENPVVDVGTLWILCVDLNMFPFISMNKHDE
ncbi:chromodomain-helicase-DNA-binding protein 4-like [Hippocampus comes]|uniref:chromodomain-helicase-DNA-binding protein 4-like n=1 Tax=Hippocampus comes TaxID=109280 RepID=UPI00094F33A7|nr:PREDICTED: chromodomain-helicase-DNA-binding protein 4-like [Hippocampus comes]